VAPPDQGHRVHLERLQGREGREDRVSGGKKQAAKFRQLADKMEEAIVAKESATGGPATVRRSEQIADQLRQAEHMRRTQAAMRGIADQLEAGTLHDALAGITSKAGVESLLDRRKYPKPSVSMGDVAKVRELLQHPELHGDKPKNLLSALDIVHGGETPLNSTQFERLEDALTYLRRNLTEGTKSQIPKMVWHWADIKRLTAAGILNAEIFDTARTELLRLADLQLEGKAPDLVAEQERKTRLISIAPSIPGYFPTPRAVGDQMVQLADIDSASTVLEPSAGTGELLEAIAETNAWHMAAVERNPDLYAELQSRFGRNEHVFADQADFLEWRPTAGVDTFDAVVMNPPFEQAQYIDHVRRAWEFVKPGGRLVAVLPEGVWFKTDKKHKAFREWMDAQGGLDEVVQLSPGAFRSEIRKTDVKARLIKITKEEAAAEPTAEAEPTPPTEPFKWDEEHVARVIETSDSKRPSSEHVQNWMPTVIEKLNEIERYAMETGGVRIATVDTRSSRELQDAKQLNRFILGELSRLALARQAVERGYKRADPERVRQSEADLAELLGVTPGEPPPMPGQKPPAAEAAPPEPEPEPVSTAPKGKPILLDRGREMDPEAARRTVELIDSMLKEKNYRPTKFAQIFEELGFKTKHNPKTTSFTHPTGVKRFVLGKRTIFIENQHTEGRRNLWIKQSGSGRYLRDWLGTMRERFARRAEEKGPPVETAPLPDERGGLIAGIAVQFGASKSSRAVEDAIFQALNVGTIRDAMQALRTSELPLVQSIAGLVQKDKELQGRQTAQESLASGWLVEQGREAVQLPIDVRLSDLDYNAALAAHRNTSMVPEDRARQEQAAYVSHIQHVYQELEPLAQTPEQKQLLESELSRYVANWLKRKKDQLYARSRTASSMITGPSGFPTRQNQKRMDTERRRMEDLFAFQEKALKSMKRKLQQARSPEQIRDTAADKLKLHIATEIETIRKIRSGEMPGFDVNAFKDSIYGRLERLAESGQAEALDVALKYLAEKNSQLDRPAFSAKHRVWDLRDVAKAAAEKVGPAGVVVLERYEGVEILDNYDEDRTQIVFAGKPDPGVRGDLKASGWRYAPSQGTGVYQRKLTANAAWSARKIVAAHYKRIEPEPAPPADEVRSYPEQGKPWLGRMFRGTRTPRGESPGDMLGPGVYYAFDREGAEDYAVQGFRLPPAHRAETVAGLRRAMEQDGQVIEIQEVDVDLKNVMVVDGPEALAKFMGQFEDQPGNAIREHVMAKGHDALAIINIEPTLMGGEQLVVYQPEEPTRAEPTEAEPEPPPPAPPPEAGVEAEEEAAGPTETPVGTEPPAPAEPVDPYDQVKRERDDLLAKMNERLALKFSNFEEYVRLETEELLEKKPELSRDLAELLAADFRKDEAEQLLAVLDVETADVDQAQAAYLINLANAHFRVIYNWPLGRRIMEKVQAAWTQHLEAVELADDATIYINPEFAEAARKRGTAILAKAKIPKHKKPPPKKAKKRGPFRFPSKEPDARKMLHWFTAPEGGKYAVHLVHVKDGVAYATDGRQSIALHGVAEKDGAYIATKDGLKKSGEDVATLNFPDWVKFAKDTEARAAMRPKRGKATPIIQDFSIEELKRLWLGARHAARWQSEEEGRAGTVVYLNKDGSIGLATYQPEVGSFEHNMHPGGARIMKVNAGYLADALEFLVKSDVPSAEIRWGDGSTAEGRPIRLSTPAAYMYIMPLKEKEREETQRFLARAADPAKWISPSWAQDSSRGSASGAGPGFPAPGPAAWEQLALNPPPDPIAGMTVNGDTPLRTHPPPGEVKPISFVEVQQAMEDVVVEGFGKIVPVRVGRMSERRDKAIGIFKPWPEVIRIRTAGDLTSASHEVGHAIEKLAFWPARPRPKGGVWKLPTVGGKIQKELAALGRALYGDRKPNWGYKSEGFAEFIRLYMLERESARTGSPATFAWFTGEFLEGRDNMTAALDVVAEAHGRFEAQGPVQRGKQMIVETTSVARRLGRLWGAIRRFVSINAQFEALQPLADLAKYAEARIRERQPNFAGLAPELNPYITGAALRKTHLGRLRHMVEREMIDLAGNPVGISLKEALSPVEPGKVDDFIVYMYAKRAMALWDDPKLPERQPARNPGITRRDAEAIILTLRSPQFEKAAAGTYEWNERVLAYAAQASPAFAQVVTKIMDRDPGHYVPLHRVFDDLDDVARANRGGGISAVSASLSARLKGSGRRIKNPFDVMLANAGRIVRAAHDRLVLDQILKLGRIEGMGHLIEEVPRDKIPVATRSLNTIMEEMIRATAEQGWGIELVDSEGQPVPLTRKDLRLIRERPDEFEGNEQVIDVLQNAITLFGVRDVPAGVDPIFPLVDEAGEIRWYHVDRELYDALDSIGDIYRLPLVMGLPMLDWTMGKPARAFRAGTTGLRASFGLVWNLKRDPQSLHMNSQANVNAGSLWAGWLHNLVVAAGFRMGRPVNNEYLAAWLRLGGEMALPLGQDIPQTRRARRRLFSRSVRDRVVHPIDSASDAVDFYRDVIQFGEIAPRVTEFAGMAKDVGWTPGEPMTLRQSILLGLGQKEVTTDFTAEGRFSRVMNQIVPFYNASIQGPRANLRAMKRNPKKFIIRGLEMTAISLLLWWYNKDKEWYKTLRPQERFMHWWFEFTNPVTGKPELIRIPTAFEVGHVFKALPELLADAWYRQSPDQATEYFKTAWRIATPGIMPVVLDELRDQWKNRDAFWDTPIVPAAKLRKPAEEQFGPYTSKLAIVLGRIFPGVSPARLDHAIEGLFGPVAGDIIELLGLGPPGLDRESEPADLVVIGRLFRRGGVIGTRPRQIDQLYEVYQEALLRRDSDEIVETADQERERLLMTDAIRAISALMYVRSQVKTRDTRENLTREAMNLAIDVLGQVKTGEIDRGPVRAARKRAQRLRTEYQEKERTRLRGRLPEQEAEPVVRVPSPFG
jgi:SAM-dependent methyltransferase